MRSKDPEAWSTTEAEGAVNMSADQQPPMFTAVSLARVSQAIVDQIRAHLREGKLRPGDRLPSERELCQQFGVSRVTVREALRVLEAGGLISIKVGARGGAFVASPTSDQVSSGLADLVTLSLLTSAEVTEARMIFELGIVPLVLERATEEDLEFLRAMTSEHEAMERRGKYTMEMSAAFHTAVADCTHNNAIKMLVQSFHGPLLMSLLEARFVAPSMGKVGVGEHAAFVNAIAARDRKGAESIMYEHLARTADRVRQVGDNDAGSVFHQ